MMSSTFSRDVSPFALPLGNLPEQLQQRITCDCKTHSAYVYGLKVAFCLMASRS